MELTVKRHGQRTEVALRCYDVTRTTPAAGWWGEGARGDSGAEPAVYGRSPRVLTLHDARAVKKKTIAMLFESPNAKLFPAFNIPPPVRLR
ncbi:unnamed protein product [Arctia plantaginis]|uniref:Uncharacterized protein n=1 Tax=Arctia plantaginis TaxID=874455 RepID=A0A8S1ASG5_ARCPL|nr:unnamed protein product [Arctia plantaginis]